MKKTSVDMTEEQYNNLRAGFKSWDEAVIDYEESFQRDFSRRFDINKWIDLRLQPLIPSDLVTIMGSTGVGKTFIAQTLCMSTDRPILFIELEISKALLTKRFLAMRNELSPWHIEQMTLHKEEYDKKGFEHVTFLNLPVVTPEIIRTEIGNMEKVIGKKPAIVILDYFQLMGCGGGNRYEAASYAAEKLRVIANQKNVIIIILSQVSRHASRREEGGLELFDAKESGSIENSSSLVLSIFKEPKKKGKYDGLITEKQQDEYDPTAYVKVLKYSHGRAGYMTKVELCWETMQIKEI